MLQHYYEIPIIYNTYTEICSMVGYEKNTMMVKKQSPIENKSIGDCFKKGGDHKWIFINY